MPSYLTLDERNQVEELKHWRSKEDALYKWIRSNSPSHPEWDSAITSLNSVQRKIEAIEKRDEYRHEIPATYSLPIKY